MVFQKRFCLLLYFSSLMIVIMIDKNVEHRHSSDFKLCSLSVVINKLLQNCVM